MASTLHYIADSSNNNKVYFDVDATPIPIKVAERNVITVKCVRGSSNPGNTRVIDMGPGTGSYTLDIYVPYCEASTYDSLLTKYDTCAQIIYSPNNGTTKYTCSWREGRSLEAIRDRGNTTLSLNIKLRIHSIA